MNALIKSSPQLRTLGLRAPHPIASASETLTPCPSNIRPLPNLPLALDINWPFVLMGWVSVRASSADLKLVLKSLHHFSSNLKGLALYQALTKIFARQTE